MEGDCLERLRELPDRSVQTCVTSPPYFGLRDYGHDGQIGLEPTPDEYVQALVGVFREVRRVLRDDGTLWLNLGDSYATGQSSDNRTPEQRAKSSTLGPKRDGLGGENAGHRAVSFGARPRGSGDAKPKDLLGIPWMVAFALRADGWYLRSDIIWSKPNPMPESVTDRPTKAHEYLFLLSKGPRYFYDADAIREDCATPVGEFGGPIVRERNRGGRTDGYTSPVGSTVGDPERGRNKRSVWEIATAPFPGAHFAVFPPRLIEPCVLAGSAERCCGVCGAPWRRVVEREPTRPGVTGGASWADGEHVQISKGLTRGGGFGGGSVETVGFEPTCDHWRPCPTCGEGPGYVSGTSRLCSRHTELVSCSDGTGSSVVLDPFAGAGTTGLVATRHGRGFIGIELNPAYAEMARERIRQDQPLFNYLTEAAGVTFSTPNEEASDA
jgi:DNA modification methylase